MNPLVQILVWLNEVLCPATGKWPCIRVHQGNDYPVLYYWLGDAEFMYTLGDEVLNNIDLFKETIVKQIKGLADANTSN